MKNILNSLKEFIRVLLPTVDIEDIKFKILKKDKNIIEVELKNREKAIIFSRKNYGFENQEIVMIKSGLLKLYNKNYKWSSLIGVRPTKLVRRFLNEGFSFAEIDEILREVYLLSKEKIKLLFDIVKLELKYLNREAINIYIGIPYCPTKCTYCSFASYEKKGKIGEVYDKFIDKLLEEIKIIGSVIKNSNKKVESIYVGGGTPVILSEIDLDRLLSEIYKNFNVDGLKEFTFEAGRTDILNVKNWKY